MDIQHRLRERTAWWRGREKEEACTDSSTDSSTQASIELTMAQDLQLCRTAHRDGADVRELLLTLVDSVMLLDEPSMCLHEFVQIMDMKDAVSVLSVLAIMVIVTEYSGDVPDFFAKFYALLLPHIFETEEDRMVLLCTRVLSAEGMSLQCVRSFVKRLCWVAIRVNTVCCARILCIVSQTLCKHKKAAVLYKDREETKNKAEYTAFQPYLYELDVLSDHPVFADDVNSIKKGIALKKRTKEEIVQRIAEMAEEGMREIQKGRT